MKVALTILLLFAGFGTFAQQMEIQIDGTLTFDESAFTIQEAGSDFSSSIVSDASFYVSVAFGNHWDQKTNSNRKWKILVQREDLTWNSDINLEIIRTGNGIWKNDKEMKSKISGGSTYFTVKEAAQEFFSGKGAITNIPVQVKLSGFSIVNGANNFETNIVLTIYED